MVSWKQLTPLILSLYLLRAIHIALFVFWLITFRLTGHPIALIFVIGLLIYFYLPVYQIKNEVQKLSVQKEVDSINQEYLSNAFDEIIHDLDADLNDLQKIYRKKPARVF